MKKLILFALLSMVLVGCSKDEEFSPVGKIYTYESSGDNPYTYNVRFINGSQYEFTFKTGDRIREQTTSTYTLDYPNVVFEDFGYAAKRQRDGVFISEEIIRVGNDEYILNK